MKHLSTKMMLGLLALVLITISLLWFYQIVFLEENYMSKKIEGIEGELQAVYADETLVTDTQLNDALDELSYRYNLIIERVSYTGDTLYATGSMMGSMMQGMTRSMGRMNPRFQIMQEAIGGVVGRLETQHTRFQSDVMLLSMPVERTENNGEVLLVTMPLESVEETVALLKEQLMQVTLVLTALTVIIGVMLARIVVKPISLLTEAAKEIAQGRLDTRVPVKSKDEIGQLTETFNEMAVQLSQIEEIRREFIANVSHELRTPLSLIQGYAETIRDLSGDHPEKRTKHAGIILDESRRLSDIVDDMLHLSRLQSGSLDMEMEPVQLAKIVKKVKNSFLLMAENRDIQLTHTISSENLVLADSRRIEQVLVNLVGNAFHYTPDGGSISIKTSNEEGRVRVSIADNGSGIPQEELEQIWERYYRSNRHHPGSFQTGSGLGLAIVKNILENHEALYGVESQEGEGTVFWFKLKMVEA